MTARRIQAVAAISVGLAAVAFGAGGVAAFTLTRRHSAPLAEPLAALDLPSTKEVLARDRLCLLALTLRAHGDSDGQRNDLGWSSRWDLEAAVSWLESVRPEAHRFVYGSSLGAAVALYAAPQLARRVRGYVLDAPYRNVDAALRNRLEHFLPQPAALVARAAIHPWAQLALDMNPDTISPATFAPSMPAGRQVLLLPGERDWRAPVEEVSRSLTRFPERGWRPFPPPITTRSGQPTRNDGTR